MRKTLSFTTLFLLLFSSYSFAEYAAIMNDKANLRTGPGTNYDLVYSLETAKYYPLKIIKKQGNWYQVQDYEGDLAWIIDSLIDVKTEAVIVKEKGNVRTEPNTNSTVLWEAAQGETFKVLQKKDLWLEVIDPVGNRGWIYKPLIWGIE